MLSRPVHKLAVMAMTYRSNIGNLMKAFLLSRRALAISKVQSDFQRGFSMDPAPYGFDAAEYTTQVEINYSDGYAASTRSSYWTWAYFGIDIPHALVNLRKMRRADVIWTVLDWEWLAASLLQCIGLLQRKPIIGNCVFLAENFKQERWSRRKLWPLLMTKNVYLTMHSQRAIDAMKEVLPSKEFHLTHFGISTRAFPITQVNIRPTTQRPIRVYSIGDDPGRDWDCMLAAFGNDSRFEMKITCRWLEQVVAGRYDNLCIPRDVTVNDQRAFYEWADIVIVPMKRNLYSGITVMCEAAAMGKPVVATMTGGAMSYFDSGEVIYVPAGDPMAMKEAVLTATFDVLTTVAKAGQERFMRADYSARGMVERYIALSEKLLHADQSSNPPSHCLAN